MQIGGDMPGTTKTGPLAGLKVVEFVGLGPGPFAAMLLADMGADVLRIDRPGGNGWPNAVHDRGRAVLTLDIRSEAGKARCLAACDLADVVIEGNRPGVMERLGLGPEVLCARNPRLIYGRMTGWGQEGPLARVAGHDLTYLALTGALDPIGVPGHPAVPPLNLIADFGGGTMFLIAGILAALYERSRSGQGQVVDAAIVDGVATMMGMFAGAPGGIVAELERGKGVLNGATPYYRCYTCADGRDIAIAPIEPQFYAEFLRLLDLPPELAATQHDPEAWPGMHRRLEQLFASRSRDDWIAVFEGSDACVAPVLNLEEATGHPHLAARGSYQRQDGRISPAAAPRFSRSPAQAGGEATDGAALLELWGSPA